MNRSKIAFLGSLFSLFILMIPTGVLGQTGFFGVYRATVTEVADPMMLGRIKVLVPRERLNKATRCAFTAL